ncbi:hypothetical protein QOZ80_9AG0692980 [Eleusine coracana subsp. coracana]|nr:hypothetical protein QOZ80_9AG0692980 [Eleusine coracana subsp. coracana]
MHAALCKVANVPPEELDEPPVKLWARDIRELSYDIEDILDCFLVRVEGHEARDPNRFKRAAKKIRKLFTKCSLGMLTQLICLHVLNSPAGGVIVPNGVIEKLTSLEYLHIEVQKDTIGQFVKDLGKLHELRVVEIHFWMGILRKVADKKPDKAIWDAAMLPQLLRYLDVKSIKFSMLPSCINPSNLPNLTHLKLCLHDMDELSQRILGGLPELRHLELSFVFYEVLIITIYAGDDGCFQKLISLSLPDLIVNFVLNEDSNVASHSEGIDEALFGSEKGDQCIVRAPVFMPNLELLNFVVEPCFKGSCDRLGLKYLPSLQKVKANFWCDYDETFAHKFALRHAINAHPNQPTLETSFIDKNRRKGFKPAHTGCLLARADQERSYISMLMERDEPMTLSLGAPTPTSDSSRAESTTTDTIELRLQWLAAAGVLKVGHTLDS